MTTQPCCPRRRLRLVSPVRPPPALTSHTCGWPVADIMTPRGLDNASRVPSGSAGTDSSAARSRVATAGNTITPLLRPPHSPSASVEPASGSALAAGRAASDRGTSVVDNNIHPASGSNLPASGSFSDLGRTVVEQREHNVRFTSFLKSPHDENGYVVVTKVRGGPGTETRIEVPTGGLPPGALHPSNVAGPPACENLAQWHAQQAEKDADPAVSINTARPERARPPVPFTGSRPIHSGSRSDLPNLVTGPSSVAQPPAADGNAVSVLPGRAAPARRVSSDTMLFRSFFCGDTGAGSRAGGRGGGGGDGGGDGGNDGRRRIGEMRPEVAQDIRFLFGSPTGADTSEVSQSDDGRGEDAGVCGCCSCGRCACGERCRGAWSEARRAPCVHVTVNAVATLTGVQLQPAHPGGTLASLAGSAAYQTPPLPPAGPAQQPWGGVAGQFGPGGWGGR